MNRTILAALAAVALAAPASAQCVGDLNGDGVIDGADLGVQLSAWGPCTGCAADINGSGVVDGVDLGLLLAAWGTCPGVPAWATVVQYAPDPTVVTDPALRAAIIATGLAWRVRDTATQIEMLLVPPGTFQMGCIMGSNLYGCSSGELPVHEVTLTYPFFLGRYEVTQSQWIKQMGYNPAFFRSWSDEVPAAEVLRRPVEQVNWSSVQSYLSATAMRLPTEAEWEYSCRAGTPTPFYNGSVDDGSLDALAWISQNSMNQTRPVGGRAANALGFHDMLGNVFELTSDWFGTYPNGAQVNPVGPTSGSWRIARGGAFDNYSSTARASRRGVFPPSGQSIYVGFRVAKNP